MEKTVEISYAPWLGEQCPAKKGDQIYLVSTTRIYTGSAYGSDKNAGDTEEFFYLYRDVPKTNLGSEQPDGWLGDNHSTGANYQANSYSLGLWRVLSIDEKKYNDHTSVVVRLKKITSIRQLRYGRLVRGWDWRTTPELLEQAEDARQKLNLSQTEFLERAITDLIERTND